MGIPFCTQKSKPCWCKQVQVSAAAQDENNWEPYRDVPWKVTAISLLHFSWVASWEVKNLALWRSNWSNSTHNLLGLSVVWCWQQFISTATWWRMAHGKTVPLPRCARKIGTSLAKPRQQLHCCAHTQSPSINIFFVSGLWVGTLLGPHSSWTTWITTSHGWSCICICDIIYIYMYNHFGVWNCLVFDCDRPRPVMIVEWLYNQMVAVRQVMMGIYWG